MTAFFVISVLLIYGCISSSTKLQVMKNPKGQPNVIHSAYKDAWSSLMDMQTDVDILKGLSSDIDLIRFGKGLELIRNGCNEKAEEIFKVLIDSAYDPMVKEYSAKIYPNLLFNSGKFQQLYSYKENSPAIDSGLLDENVLINAFRSAAKEEYHFPEQKVKLPISISKTGTPVVSVMINQKKFSFWIDTGAGLSVLSSEVATECGIQQIGNETTTAGTATSKQVSILPAIIDSLSIGGLQICNHPAIIIDKSELEFKLLGLFTIVKIDGIIGWNAIKNMYLEIDYAHHEIIINKPLRKEDLKSNFFWLGYPIVELVSENGVLLYFGLDTGARTSSITENIFPKLESQSIETKKEMIGSAGGFEKLERKILPHLVLHLGEYSLQFNDIKTLPSKGVVFIKSNGVLGSDIAAESKITIDYINNFFGIEYVMCHNEK